MIQPSPYEDPLQPDLTDTDLVLGSADSSAGYQNTMTYTVDSFAASDTISINTHQKPADPIEEAELRLSGKCTECRQDEAAHAWTCSKYQFELSTVTGGLGGTGYANWVTINTQDPPAQFSVGSPDHEWKLDITGTGAFEVHVPEGKQPNWFHRKMQKMFFGIEWSKKI